MTDEVYVVLLDFKTTKSREMVTANEDGSYTIFINSRMSRDIQEKAYQHALGHIRSGDFDMEDVQQIEVTAHELPKKDTSKRITSFDYIEWIKKSRKKSA